LPFGGFAARVAKKTETTADAEPVLRKCYLEFLVIRGYILAEAQKSGRH